MRSPANILIAILLLWMFGSSYYYVCKIKGICNEPTSTVVTVINTDVKVEEPETVDDEVDITVEEEDIVSVEEAMTIDNKTVYFGFRLNNLTLDDELKTYMSDLSVFMQEHKDQGILLIGHTDTIGSENVNNLMGMERAKFVKKMLVEAGIDVDQIKTESKGENEAFASSDTEEGRGKDRRVEIITK